MMIRKLRELEIGVAALIAALFASLIAAASPPAFADEAVKADKPIVTASGLEYISVREGTGPHPAASDVVKVNYRGTFPDGVEFDSSYKRNMPAEFPLNRVIKCWTEGVQLMKVGGKAKLTCPSAIAYGEHGKGMIPPNATLVFEIELLAIGAGH